MTVIAASPAATAPAPLAPEVSGNASSGMIVRNALMSYVGSAVGMLVGFVVTPILVRTLGSELFGLWVLLGSVVGYTGLVELGLSTATAKRVAECRATGDRERLERVLGTAAVLFAAVAAIALVATIVLAVLVDHLFRLPPETVRTARVCMLILGVNQVVLFLFIVQTAILFGSGRMDLMTGASIALNLATAACTVAMVLAGFGIVSLALTTLAGGIANGLIMRWIIRRRLPDVRVHPRLADRQTARELLRFGSRNAGIAVCGTLAFGADSLIIGLLLPVANVTHYAIASKLVNLVRTLATKPVDVLMPAYSHSHALGEQQRLFRLFTNSVLLPLAIAIPLGICLCVFGRDLLRLWVGPGHEQSYLILVVLAATLVLQLFGHASFTILTGTEQNSVLLRINAVAALVNVLLSVGLTYLLGPIGVALGSLVTVMVADTVVLPWHVCRRFGFCYRSFLGDAIFPLAIPSFVCALLAAIAYVVCIRTGPFWALPSSAVTVGVTWLFLAHRGILPISRLPFVGWMSRAAQLANGENR